VSERDAAFSDFVRARRTHLRRIAYAVCGDWHQADDLVQTALVKLYAAWPRVRRDGREEAYVRRIIVRAHVDETRRPWRRERPAEAPPETAARAGVAPEERDALFEALQALPAMQRRTVLLRHWLGLSVAETAAELGIAEGTVKSHTSRALSALQGELASSDCPGVT
jgi:RNA polymerase sigma-70 factor (sigma-E family)